MRGLLRWHAHALWILGLGCWGTHGTVGAQPVSATTLDLRVKAGPDGSVGCFEPQALRRRIAHYRQKPHPGIEDPQLVLVVDGPDSAELRVLHRGELISVRRFVALPEACAERRDAVALSIALALAGASAGPHDRSKTQAKPREQPPPGSADRPRRRGAAASSDARRAAQRTARAGRGASHGAPGTPTANGSARASPSASSSTATSQATSQADSQAHDRVTTEAGGGETRAATTSTGATGQARDAPVAELRVPVPPAPARRVAGAGAGGPLPEAHDEQGVAEASGESEPAGPPADPFLRARLHLGGRLLAGAAPAPVWAAALGAQLVFPSRISIDAAFFSSTSATRDLAGGTVRAGVTGGELLGCLDWPLGAVALSSCAGAASGVCRAEGRGFPQAAPTATLWWVASTARVAVRWPAEDLIALRLLAQGHVNLVQPELVVDGVRAQASPGWLGGLLGVDLVFWLD